LRADHAPAVLELEVSHREYFTRSVSDRGDEFFAHFTEHLGRLLADQEAGSCAFHVLVDDDGAVLGRFNLDDFRDGAATVGYRMAEHAAGRGVATAALRELCDIAAGLGLRVLTAAVSDENHASRKVLLNAGFVPEGPADPSEIGGKSGTRFRRELGGP
jgi:ribosomal-protein-alanine N-acetyltransferase